MQWHTINNKFNFGIICKGTTIDTSDKKFRRVVFSVIFGFNLENMRKLMGNQEIFSML